MSISNIDKIKNHIYDSKFKDWINSNNYLTALFIDEDCWRLKTINSNLNLKLININGFYVIKCIFVIGFIHVKKDDSLDRIVESIMRFSEKSDIIGHIFCHSIDAKEDSFIYVSLECNIYDGIDIRLLFDNLFAELNRVKLNLSVMLGLNILSLSDLDNDDDNDEDDESSPMTTPYDISE